MESCRFKSIEQANEVLGKLTNFLNALPKWILKGHASTEIHRSNEKPKSQPLTQMPFILNMIPKTGRNDPCPCGSGKKYKDCQGKVS